MHFFFAPWLSFAFCLFIGINIEDHVEFDVILELQSRLGQLLEQAKTFLE